METCCGYEYDWGRGYSSDTRIFKGRRECSGPPKRGGSARTGTAAPTKSLSRPHCSQKEKKTLPRIPAGVSGLLRVAATPAPQFRKNNLTPFRRAPRGTSRGHTPRLRIDSPAANCCSRGTLLHFSLQSSHLNSCYYHQDLHQQPLQPRSRTAFRATAAPSYSSERRLTLTVEYGYHASAPSIFSASSFGR